MCCCCHHHCYRCQPWYHYRPPVVIQPAPVIVLPPVKYQPQIVGGVNSAVAQARHALGAR